MELTPYYSNANSEGAYIYLPAFAGGTAGRSIRILVIRLHLLVQRFIT